MQIAKEEIFGPVMSIIKWRSLEEITYRANNSIYGLAAGVWTKDVDKANYFARALKAGTIWVNTWNIFDAAAPFGGYKRSGIGRDKGEHALQHYTETKTIITKLPKNNPYL